MTVILYIRCRNPDAHGEQTQLEQLRNYAHKQGYEIVEEIIETDTSGLTLARIGIRQMVDIVRSNKIDLVLAVNHSRIARRAEDYCKLERTLREHGTVLVLLHDFFCNIGTFEKNCPICPYSPNFVREH